MREVERASHEAYYQTQVLATWRSVKPCAACTGSGVTEHLQHDSATKYIFYLSLFGMARPDRASLIEKKFIVARE